MSPRSNALVCLALLASLAVSFQSTTATAAGEQPSAKGTAAIGDLSVVNGPTLSGQADGQWMTIMTNGIKTANERDLFVDVSLETGLFTETVVKSKNGNRDTSTATAQIEIRVCVDGNEAHPGPVVFDRRNQELSAVFQGIITDAIMIDPDTGAIVIDETLVLDEELSLLLETLSAHSFNFLAPNVSTGVHQVEVQARITTGSEAQAGSAVAKATVGKGSMAVESVRLIQGEDLLLE